MSCTKCGGALWANDLYCPRCGAPAAVWTQPPPATPAPSSTHTRTAILAVLGVLVLALGGVVAYLVLNRADGGTSRAAATGTPSSSRSTSSSASGDAPQAAAASSSGPADFASVYQREQSGVVRIQVVGCSDSGIGSGFLLSPTLVATVDHVVTDSVVVSLVDGDQHTTGTVIGHDAQHDLALVRAADPLTGYQFHFAAHDAQVGARVAAIGFPIGDPITLTQGGVSGLDRDVTVDGQPRHGLVETDAAVNPGNSGGPLLAEDGSVIGLVDALNPQANGIAYAVPATQAQPAMTGWQQAPTDQRQAQCDTPLGPSQASTELGPIPGLSDDASDGIRTALQTYFDGINSGDYESAWEVLSPRLQAGVSDDSFAEGDATSFDSDETVLAAHQVDDRSAKVALQFTSIQAPDSGPDGDTCDVWTLNYSMIEGNDGSWYMDAAKPYHGSSHETC